jgi:hypothetical protein
MSAGCERAIAFSPATPGHSYRPEGGAMNSFDYANQAALFDYDTEAELFSAKTGRKLLHQPLGYRRFARAADAIRFAIEDLPSHLVGGTYLEVGEQRYHFAEIRRLYDSVTYPLPRRSVILV